MDPYSLLRWQLRGNAQSIVLQSFARGLSYICISFSISISIGISCIFNIFDIASLCICSCATIMRSVFNPFWFDLNLYLIFYYLGPNKVGQLDVTLVYEDDSKV